MYSDDKNVGGQSSGFSVLAFLDTVWRDLRVARRNLMTHAGFTAMVVLSLGLGIGANTAIFSFIDGILLRPVAVPHASDLVTLDTAASRVTAFGDTSYPDYVDVSRQSRDLLGAVAFRRVTVGLNPDASSAQARPTVIWGLLVSGNYFSVLDVQPVLGRGFLPEDDQAPGKAPVAIISFTAWRRTFAGDPHVVGRSVKLNGHLYTIVGVAPKSFSGLELAYRPDIYVPAMMIADILPTAGSQLLASRHSRSWVVRGRLRPGVTVAHAQAEADRICANLTREYPAANKDTRFILRRELDYRLEGTGVALPAVLTGLVFLVLLIACANVASLLMARATAGMRGIVTRLALGASRRRLIRQLMTESTVLAFLGGACGLLLAAAGIRLATTLVPYTPAPQGPAFQMDLRVILYALAASTATVFLCGVAPAFMATREGARAVLRVRSASSRAFGAVARRTLIGCQVALSLILLIAGSLFLKTFSHLQTVDLGFNPNHVFVVAMNPALNNYSTDQSRLFFKTLRDRSAALPGVKSASLTAIPPFLGLYSWDISVDGYMTPGGDTVVDTLTNRVSPEYFDTLQIRFLHGRTIGDTDTAESPKVAIVNETFARRFIVGKSALDGAIGHALRHRGSDQVPIRIVGIVNDSTYGTVTPLGSAPAPVFYIPVLQYADSYLSIQVRTEGGGDEIGTSILQQIHGLDPEVAPIYSVPLSAIVSARALYLPRVIATLSGILALSALTLAIVGLYGVISHSVECQTQEIGIRMALGAQKSAVLKMVLASSVSLVALGLVAGLIGALVLAPYLASLLAGVGPHDPLTFVLLPIAMLMATIIASLIPAARAARVEPVTALRYE
jgi:predicted permease